MQEIVPEVLLSQDLQIVSGDDLLPARPQSLKLDLKCIAEAQLECMQDGRARDYIVGIVSRKLACTSPLDCCILTVYVVPRALVVPKV